MKKNNKPRNVDQYIAMQPVASQPRLKEIRSLIRSAAPMAEEVISYMIPCYKLHGMLVGFGNHKKGSSFYTMSTTILKEHEKELKGFDYSGSTLHIRTDQKLPVPLLEKIIKKRISHNTKKAKLKLPAKK